MFNPNPQLFKPCDEKRYNDMLEILPPIAWVRKGFLIGEPYSHRTCRLTNTVRPTYTAMVHHRGALGEHYFESTSSLTVPEWNALNPNTLTIDGVP